MRVYPEEVIEGLRRYSRYPVPENIEVYVRDTMAKFGILKLTKDGDSFVLRSSDEFIMEEIRLRTDYLLTFKKSRERIL